jgi:hypothetical protein
VIGVKMLSMGCSSSGKTRADIDIGVPRERAARATKASFESLDMLHYAFGT